MSRQLVWSSKNWEEFCAGVRKLEITRVQMMLKALGLLEIIRE